MINAIKAELRKLFTVRSTYILTALAFASVILISFYAVGYRAQPDQLKDTHLLLNTLIEVLISIPFIFPSIVAILFITHEYRYNTITYTLTASNSRTKVLVAKILALTIYALPLTAVLAVVAGAMVPLGVMAHGHHLVAQSIPYLSLAWRCLLYGWESILIALAIGVIVRSQVGAIVAMFVIPTVEGISTTFLKGNAVYLPFTSSNAILMTPTTGTLTYGHAALLFSGYVVLAWIVGWILFLRRDAS